MFFASLVVGVIFALYFAFATGLARSVIHLRRLHRHLRRDGVTTTALVTGKTRLATYVRFDLPGGDRVDAKIPMTLRTAVAGHEDVVYSPTSPNQVLPATGLSGRHTWLLRRAAIAVAFLAAGLVGVASFPWDWG